MSKELSDNQINDIIGKMAEDAKKNGKRKIPEGASLILTCDAGVFDAGCIFEAETTKGHKNYILFMMERDGWIYYVHGDKTKKTQSAHFKDLISYGDLIPVPREKADPEKLALSALGLNAMLNGLSFNDYLKVIWGHGDGSEVR